MSYWDATDQYLRRHGSNPICPNCGKEMFPEDDHGRFSCLCGGGTFDVVTGHLLTPLQSSKKDSSQDPSDNSSQPNSGEAE